METEIAKAEDRHFCKVCGAEIILWGPNQSAGYINEFSKEDLDGDYYCRGCYDYEREGYNSVELTEEQLTYLKNRV